MHQNFDASAPNGARSFFRFFLGQELIEKPMAIMPTSIFNQSSENQLAVKPPMITPIIAGGMHCISCVVSHFFQNFCTVNRSIIHRIGSMIAAACMGDVFSEMSGTAMMPKAPENPPLEMPVIITAIEISKISSQSIDNLSDVDRRKR